jgi:phosphatidylinositol kinase/protein kinase (PI-3  family)
MCEILKNYARVYHVCVDSLPLSVSFSHYCDENLFKGKIKNICHWLRSEWVPSRLVMGWIWVDTVRVDPPPLSPT